MAQLGNAEAATGGRLANRVALVTGASRGLGRFFAETLARQGAHVILGNRSDVPEIAEAIARAGGKANFVAMDVTRDDSILRAFEAIVTQWGPPTIVVNNAGITDVVDTLDEDPAEFDRILSTNLRGPWMIAREAAHHMVAAKIPGAIVNVASILALRQAGRVTAYATAKAGLVQMTKQMALEWARFGIRVNALAPGYVETDFNRDFFRDRKGAGDDPAHPVAPAGANGGPGRAVDPAGGRRRRVDYRRGAAGRCRPLAVEPLTHAVFA